MYIHVSKCKNDKIKKRNSGRDPKVLERVHIANIFMIEGSPKWEIRLYL
jgi:hypothetical protein